MRIFVPMETTAGETRIALVPATAEKLVKLGAEVEVETGLGAGIHFPDEEYRQAGADISRDRAASLARADIVLRVRASSAEVAMLKRGCIHISYLDPFNNQALVQAFTGAGVHALSMEMIPRSTVAQKMDVLSSQANLGGYVAVTLAATASTRIFPLMMTPAGTIRPARVLVIGVGVAGLQAIATAKRLGAAVAAFDTRPVVEEQVRSLGARFVKIDLGETGQTEQGYARELTSDQLARQREALAAECAESDVVITAAQVFGRKAPVIVTRPMIERMKAGSVVVDMSVETGGNVECSRLGEQVEINGVQILGYPNLPGRVPRTASQMYSNNIGNLVEHFWRKETRAFRLDPADPILEKCIVAHGDAIHHAPAPAPAPVPQPGTNFPL